MKKDLSFIKSIIDGIADGIYEAVVVADDKGNLVRQTTANKEFTFGASDWFLLNCQSPMTTITVGTRKMRIRESGNSTIEKAAILATGNSYSKGLFVDIKALIAEGEGKGFEVVNKRDDGKGNVAFDALLLMPIKGKFLTMTCEDYTPMVKDKDGKFVKRRTEYQDKTDGKKKFRDTVFSTFKFFIPAGENGLAIYESEYRRQVEPYIIKGQATDEPASVATNVEAE